MRQLEITNVCKAMASASKMAARWRQCIRSIGYLYSARIRHIVTLSMLYNITPVKVIAATMHIHLQKECRSNALLKDISAVPGNRTHDLYTPSQVIRPLDYDTFTVRLAHVKKKKDLWWPSQLCSGLFTGRFWVRNQVDALVSFDKALILITKSLG